MAGLYLHIPFCQRKCSYCDFYSVESDTATLESYAGLLIKQLTRVGEQGLWLQPFESIYFGGGTPSLLSPTAIASILEVVSRHYRVSAHVEITLEANPGTVSLQSLEGYREAGINRLSLGLQSCNDNHLVNLGRLHDRQAGLDAFGWARSAGFENISLDLMFALPGQNRSELEDELQSYLGLKPEHLSCYGLTAEPGTPFEQKVASGQLTLPDEDFYAEAFLLIDERLTADGYDHYEIANYARPGLACRHNLGYWQRTPYLGIGAGAHSFHDAQWGSRWQVPADLDAYRLALHARQEPTICLETFDRNSALSETVYLALRTRYGVSDAALRQRFGCTLQDAFPEALASCAQWLSRSNGRWSLSPSGWLLYDRLILPFL